MGTDSVCPGCAGHGSHECEWNVCSVRGTRCPNAGSAETEESCCSVPRILAFIGEHRWLSNFHPVFLKYEGQTYPSSEHAYQAAKTMDPALREEIAQCSTPGDAKRMGRGVTLRMDWESVKLQVMEDILREKFQDVTLGEKLIDTNDAKLVEGNTWNDTFWGVCRGVGENHLGKILMKIRTDLQHEALVSKRRQLQAMNPTVLVKSAISHSVQAADDPPVRKHSVVNGEILNLSVTQITKYDPNQDGGCPRKWYREYVLRDKPPQKAAAALGDELHKNIEHYLKTGEDVLTERVRAGKHFIPAPGPDLLVEFQFDGRHLVAAGVAVNGKIDLLHNRGRYVDTDGSTHDERFGKAVAEVEDWKTSASVANYGKTGPQLVETIQMVGYGKVAQQVFPHATHVRLSHGYFQTRGKRVADKRSIVIPVDTINSKWENVEVTVRAMKDVARELEFLKVEPNFAACGAFGGCPYREHCPRSAEQAAIDLFGKGTMQSLLNRGVSPVSPAPPPLQTVAAAPVVPTLGQSMLLRQLGSSSSIAQHATPSAAVVAEAQRLVAQQAAGAVPTYVAASAQAASEAPICFYCGTPLNPSNASRLAEGGYKHIGCPKAPVSVLPPDAPRSQPHLAAQSVPAEAAMAMSPVVQAAIAEHNAAAAQSGGATPAAEVPAPAPKKRSSKKRTAAAQSGAVPAADADRDQSGIALFVDVAVTGELEVDSLDEYLRELCQRLCTEYGAVDVRCAPNETPLAFGKWKGALAALIRVEPPAAGHYLVSSVDGDEVKQVLVQTIAEFADLVVRGVR